MTSPAAPLPPSSPCRGEEHAAAGVGVCPPQLLPQTPAPVQPRCCSVHTQSSLFPPAQHLVTPHSRVCLHTHHARRVHPSRCYLLTSIWCTPRLAPVAVSHPVHTHPRRTLLPLSHTHGTRSVLVRIRSCCCLTPGARSLLLLSRPRRTRSPGARSLLLPSRTWCTLTPVHAGSSCRLALDARSPTVHGSPPTHAPLSPHAPSLALFTPSPGPRPAWGAAGAPRSHLTMPYMTRTLPSSPTTHTTE